MKLTGIFLIILSGVLLIFKIYYSHVKRISFLKRLISDSEILKNEILFMKTPVYDAVANLKSNGACDKFYEEILNSLNGNFSVKDSFSKGFKAVSDILGEKSESVFTDFGNLLGATDSDGQKCAFSSFICGLEKALEEAETEKKEKLKPRCAAISFIFTAIILFVI